MNLFEKKKPEDKIKAPAKYEEVYLKPVEMERRQCTYISRRNHRVISMLIRTLEIKGLTLGGYIDNVLTEHIDRHKVEINRLYLRERNDLL
jgi:hypothetical protein